MTHDLFLGLKWLDKHKIEDGDIEAIYNFMTFSNSSGNNTICYNKYFNARHYFLDSYESDFDCIKGNDWYDLVVNMYKNGYKISLKRVIDN